MIPESDLEIGQYRLLDVDNHIMIPVDCHIRFIASASDVLHSFAVPSLGIKIDCCPGRLNQVSVLVERAGTYYGQCSELCGTYHGFMPVVIEAVPVNEYISFLNSFDETK
jgi:cytochrome c oxidase subunit 2